MCIFYIAKRLSNGRTHRQSAHVYFLACLDACESYASTRVKIEKISTGEN